MKKSETSLIFYIGIDVSKLTLDVTLLNSLTSKLKYIQISNCSDGLKKLNSWLRKIPGFKYPKAVFCLEHTGLYTRVLLEILSNKEANIWMEASLRIKKSLGLNRGKNDKIDSQRIAEYAYRFIDKAQFYENNLPEIVVLKDLISCRSRLKKQLKSNLVAINELKRVDPEQGIKLETLTLSSTRGIQSSIENVEKEMLLIINKWGIRSSPVKF